jgi:hypothetical protein
MQTFEHCLEQPKQVVPIPQAGWLFSEGNRKQNQPFLDFRATSRMLESREFLKESGIGRARNTISQVPNQSRILAGPPKHRTAPDRLNCGG